MDLSLTEKDIVCLSSDYAIMLAICKKHILNLEYEARRHLDDYIMELSQIPFGADSTLDEHMELWLKDLKTRLKEYEFYGRATSLKTFLSPSNYIHVLRTPTKRMDIERSMRIPVHNVTLPVEIEDLRVSFVRPRNNRKRKCVPTRVVSVCGMENN